MRTSRRWRRPAVAAIAAVALGTAGLWLAGGGSASAGTITGTFYRDPDSQVLRWLAANPGDSRAALIRDRIGVQPQARWFTNPNTAATTSAVQSYVGAANAAGQVPVLVAYAIPNRDCGGASAGGTATLTEYAAWVRAFAAGLGTRTAVVLLEPDSLALQTCLDAAGVSARDAALAAAVGTVKQANPAAKVYLDAGHSAWNSAGEQAGRLVAAGVRNADGFYSNVSNFRTTADEVAYGRSVLGAIGAANLHQVVDTSRNGRGPNGSQWCDPAGRGVGTGPTTSTGEASVDAFVWVKPPGEADGCSAGAGQFVPDLAYQLALNGVVPSTPPTSQSPSASPSASPSKSPSASPSRSPSSSPSQSQGGTGCSVAYRVDNQWNNGFTATVTVTNRGPGTVSGWTLTFAFAGDQRVSNAWNATATQSGNTVTVRDGGWNGTLPAGGTASFGFQAGYSGTNAAPAAFKLNGTACS
jgi:endoglucanase